MVTYQDDTSGQKNTMEILVTSYMNQLKIPQKITFVPHTSISPIKALSSQCWSQVPMTIYGFAMLVTVRNAGHSFQCLNNTFLCQRGPTSGPKVNLQCFPNFPDKHLQRDSTSCLKRRKGIPG
ncbi:hypothetical protein C5167_034969 [Papaver somniferum]|uniref:Uncharacterized protein n=1 Tax=Papaver somniferum TaxID=3469 RepID=A0A4Y7KH79_PAPSO|nr:hypothetical protein C5167_034969 [Papaver somniferum]